MKDDELNEALGAALRRDRGIRWQRRVDALAHHYEKLREESGAVEAARIAEHFFEQLAIDPRLHGLHPNAPGLPGSLFG